VGNSANLDLSPLSPGSPCLAVGPHTITLAATNSSSQTAATSVSITVLADADRDGMSLDKENAVNVCRPGGAEPTPDLDPGNATADYDNDGIVNRDDPRPCDAATSYTAVSLFAPAKISLSANQSTASFQGILLTERDLSTVNPASVVITNIGGYDLGPSLTNTNWIVVNQIGAAKFDLRKIVAFLNSKGIVNRTVAITMVGQGPGWSFTAVASAVITP
jgi:hypothetical protein